MAEVGEIIGEALELQPLHELLAKRLISLIEARGIQPGERLPAGRELRATFGVSRETVARAVGHLAEMGLVHRKRGSGFVLARPVKTARGAVALLFGKGMDLFADPIWAEAHGAILAALQSAGYEISVSVLGEGFDRRRFLADIESRRRHGLIITANISPEIAERASAVVPVVAVRDCLGTAKVLWSTCDNDAAAEAAVAHLASLGHRRIAYVGDMVSVSAGRERLEGLRRAMERRGLALPEQLVSGDRPVEEGGRFHCPRGTPPYWVRRDLLDGSGRPTAAVCVSLGHTDNLVALARSSGLRIPDDLSVVSMVDCPQYAGSDEPRITVVQTMTRGLGENAVRLLRKAEGGLREKRVLRAAPELRVRASTAPPREGS